MNVNSNLESAAFDFLQAVGQSNNDTLSNDIQTLSKEIMQHAENQQNTTESCSAIIQKASELRNKSKHNLDDNSMTSIESQFEKLSKLAMAVLHDKMIESQADSTWLLDFLKLDKNVQKELLNDPQISQRFNAAISKAGPNLIVNPDTGLTLFIRLAFDSSPEIRKFTSELIRHKDIDINQGTKNGNTAPHAAARNNDDVLIKDLLAAGADPSKAIKMERYLSMKRDTPIVVSCF